MSDVLKVRVHNAEALPLRDVPVLSANEFRRAVIDGIRNGGRLAAFFGRRIADRNVNVIAAIAFEDDGDLAVLSMDPGAAYQSITPECTQAHWFEREVAEQWGIEVAGHPWLKPIRFQPPFMEGPASGVRPVCGAADFFQMCGEEVHEVAVGPVHAGVIEPGHFRFQCLGEEVHHLEISLGYQHRGVERALVGGPDKRTIHYMETLAGDTTIGHSFAYCQALEALSSCTVPPRGMVIRAIALELERLANHIGDLGALAGDVGFLPTASYCGRIRGDVLNATAKICGNRFGRGLIRPGGIAVDLDTTIVADLLGRLPEISADTQSAVNLLWDAPSVTARFEDTGTVPFDVCEEIGLVGVASRACGVDRDVRRDLPYGIYRFAHIPTATWEIGDVFGRAHVRDIEVQRSFAFIMWQLETLPTGAIKADMAPLMPDHLVVSMVEGWRGEICHVAVTGPDGRFSAYKAVDPSFHNWFGLAFALRGQQISDFPLCNKSFNLSYCGHDL